MPWWPNALSPSSSSSPNSQHQQQLQHRRLTRAKKLRHLRQQDLYDLDLLQSNDYLRSPPEVDISASDRFSSAVPHPLPLPDLSALFSHSDKVRKSDAGSVDNFLLPSPNGTSKERERGGGRERSSHVSNDIASARNRRILQVDARGRPDAKSNVDVSQKVDAQRSVQRAETCKGMPQRIKGMDRVRDKFAIEIPFRSAPTSAYSSPVPSPQRLSTGDMFSAFRTEPLGCSAPEMRLKFMSTGFPYAVPQDNLVFSRDNSPLRSPQIKSPMQPRMSTTGSASPRHPKLLIDASTGLHESTCHVKHPLPLPPGATSSTQSSPVPLRGTRPDSLPLRTQWTKGKLIGRGTFGSVYVGTNRETGALCAMKEVDLFPDDPKSIECMKQLEQEIKVFSRLKHPNIVQYYGSQIVEDQFYIYLEYVYPGSINKYVREHCGAVTESVVRNFTRHILYGLAYLHSRKTVHRDIKGANLLVDSSGVVKLADFGMARHLAGQAADLSLKGSPYWMAPELMQAVLQKDNNSDLAFAVDIWSLGCTIIEMLTGKPPWSEYEGAAAMFKVLRESPPIPETLSPEGKDFLRCCFQRNPADRPTANMLLEHRFLRNSQQDKAHSPRELAEYKLDKTPLSPSRWTMKGKLVSNNETGQNSNLGTPDLIVGPRHSPRSTLDTLPNISPPHAVPSPQDLGIPSASRLHNQLPELMSPFSKRWK